MKQRLLLRRFKKFIREIDDILCAMIVGSFANNQAGIFSDINLQVLTIPEFEMKLFSQKIKSHFSEDVRDMIWIHNERKLLVYFFEEYHLLEIRFCGHLHEMDKMFLGSSIKNIHQCIVLDNDGILKSHLQKILDKKKPHVKSLENRLRELTGIFIYNFERCSFSHQRIDEYKFYYYYYQCLQALVQLKFLAQKGRTSEFMPKNFVERYLNKRQKIDFQKLCAPEKFTNANEPKRLLLDFFFETLRKIDTTFTDLDIDNITMINFCEKIFQRDYLLNFRDICRYNSKIMPGRIFRSYSLTDYKDQKTIIKKLKQLNIRSIIDLRYEQERHKAAYNEAFIKHFKYINLPINPEKMILEGVDEHKKNANGENIYRLFAQECKGQVRQLVNHILNNTDHATLIHCAAGKDRTGVMVALLQLVAGSARKDIEYDYLASGGNMSLKKINAFINVIDQHNGIKKYLKSCNISEDQFQRLVNFIVKKNNPLLHSGQQVISSSVNR